MQDQIEQFYKNYQGAEDLRSPEEKAKDYSQSEFVASANPVNWTEKLQPHEWRQFPVLNQFYTFKCVAFTIAKLAMINFWLQTKDTIFFSPNSIYHYRSNKPSGGMIGINAFDIWRDKGIALEATAKSDQTRDEAGTEVNTFAQEVAKGFKLGSYITIPNGDFERIASTIQTTGKGVMLWFYFTDREFSLEKPKVLDNLASPYDTGASRHSVTAVDFGLIGGKKYLKIEDSAHFGGLNTRFIDEDFFKARNFFNAYPMNFKYVDHTEDQYTPQKPTYNGSIISVQKCLQFEGLFPDNIGFVESFGPITQKSVMAFQVKHKLHPTGVPNIGPATQAKLRELYP